MKDLDFHKTVATNEDVSLYQLCNNLNNFMCFEFSMRFVKILKNHLIYARNRVDL